MRAFICLCLLMLLPSLASAHTPVCRCTLNAQTILCEGGYHDGSGASDITMRVISYHGETLASGELNAQHQFITPLPGQPFFILMDVGPGEMFEVDWKDIYGMDRQHFAPSQAPTHTPSET